MGLSPHFDPQQGGPRGSQPLLSLSLDVSLPEGEDGPRGYFPTCLEGEPQGLCPSLSSQGTNGLRLDFPHAAFKGGAFKMHGAELFVQIAVLTHGCVIFQELCK